MLSLEITIRFAFERAACVSVFYLLPALPRCKAWAWGPERRPTALAGTICCDLGLVVESLQVINLFEDAAFVDTTPTRAPSAIRL